jgi:hypothetical protein
MVSLGGAPLQVELVTRTLSLPTIREARSSPLIVRAATTRTVSWLW